jgi:tetraacyldisaccharide 4'-kinase
MNRAATVALAPIAGLYGIFVKARNASYRRGILPTQHVDVPVISVGNLTSGGTGKTPLVEWTARELASLGLKVCILTRGYGRRNPRRQVIASNGIEILAQVSQTGDEAFMLAERLRGQAAVICNADRVSAAGWAIKNLGSQVFVLDDAFQHRRLARDLNLLTIDASNPWGNRRCLPAGILRESIEELARADCVVLTRSDLENDRGLENEIERIHPGMPVLKSRMRHTRLREVNTNPAPENPEEIKALRVGAFCGIGNSESFFELLRRQGYVLTYQRSFRDHHNFTQGDIDLLIRQAQTEGAQALLVTAKDAAKLGPLKIALPCYAVEIEIEIEHAERLREMILTTVGKRPIDRRSTAALS